MAMLKRLVPGLVVLGVVVGLAAGGRVTWASIPDAPTGEITTCYPTSGPDQGRLTVIDASGGQHCGAGDSTLSWQHQAQCDAWAHPGVDWSMPGSTPGNGCNFAGLNFPTGDATDANFINANLTGTNLGNLRLTGAIYTGANLTNATVGGSFTNAGLRSAYAVAGIDLSGQHQSGWDMSSLDLSGARLRGDLTNVQFSNANLTRAHLNNADLTGATFTGANLRGAYVESVGFTNADLRAAATLTGLHLSSYARLIPMSDWDFSNLDLSNAWFQYAILDGANMTGTNLSNATFKYGNVNGVIWSNTTCPDGTNSDSHGNTCVGHL